MVIRALAPLKGNVTALIVEEKGLMYRVVYWWECKRYVEWLHDWEIDAT